MDTVKTIASGGQKPKQKGKADVAFVIDVTASMEPCLENLKANLVNLGSQIDSIAKKDYGVASPEIGYTAVGFRDLEEDVADKPMMIRDTEFTVDLGEIKAFFSTPDMAAAGGGSIEESALDALYVALTKLNWKRSAGVVVLFTDAPTRPVLHPSTVGGRKLDAADSIQLVKQEIGNKRIIIFGPQGVPEFAEICVGDYCIYKELEKAHDTLKAFEDSKLFEENVIKLMAKTATQSATKPFIKP